MFANFSDLDLNDTPITNIRSAVRNDIDTRVVLDLNSAIQARSFCWMRMTNTATDWLLTSMTLTLQAPESRLLRLQQMILQMVNGTSLSQFQLVMVEMILAPSGLIVFRKKSCIVDSSPNRNHPQKMPGYKPVMVRDGDYYVKTCVAEPILLIRIMPTFSSLFMQTPSLVPVLVVQRYMHFRKEAPPANRHAAWQKKKTGQI